MKVILGRWSSVWTSFKDTKFIKDMPRFCSSGERVTDPHAYGLGQAIEAICRDIGLRAYDLARDWGQELEVEGEKQFSLTGTIKLRHDVDCIDNRMAIKLEVDVEEVKEDGQPTKED